MNDMVTYGRLTTLQPPSSPRPKGCANGMAGTGRCVVIAGQIGWDADGDGGDE